MDKQLFPEPTDAENERVIQGGGGGQSYNTRLKLTPDFLEEIRLWLYYWWIGMAGRL